MYRSDVIAKIGVTFLCPLGKVTKESGIGEAFEARAVSTRIHPPLCTPPVAHLGSAVRSVAVTVAAQQLDIGGGSALAALPNFRSSNPARQKSEHFCRAQDVG